MTNFTIRNYEKLYSNDELFKALNSTFAGVNAHCYKQGNNVRLFADAIANRAEIWKKAVGYDMYIGVNTPLYNVGKSLLVSEWVNSGKLKHSKSNELALQNLTASDVDMILGKLERIPETPKPSKRGRGKGKANAQAEAV